MSGCSREYPSRCSCVLLAPTATVAEDGDGYRQARWQKSQSYEGERHCCVLISRSIKYPLKDKLVMDFELENHLILELRDLSRPDVLQLEILLAQKGVMTCHSPFKMIEAQIQVPTVWFSILPAPSLVLTDISLRD